MMQDVQGELSVGLSWRQQHSTSRRLFIAENYISTWRRNW